ncbi:hypothetical protein DWQ65_04150 [Treponema phagedenis]|nr:hypothetical protein DWQ65_04150 [Treponema phagedenis]
MKNNRDLGGIWERSPCTITAFFNTSYQIVKNFIKKSPTRRNGGQFTIGMLKSASPLLLIPRFV